MCESSVYIKQNDKEELVMENVASITPVEEDRFLLKGLLGEQKEVSGRIADINLMAHKIILIA
ncbi:MAG: CooT family nickel-binding protein [Desulfarculaceae bacterium]|nr:CooT family nickel-binding protein [Desulfarculaceae bacterium]